MKIDFLCSDSQHPINEYLLPTVEQLSLFHQTGVFRKKCELLGGDILFLISCSEIVERKIREKYSYCLVLHASDLPVGRGWSPHIWAIINGCKEITLSLLEAEDQVDSGRIWKKIVLHIPLHALWDEINSIVFTEEMNLIHFAIEACDRIQPVEQSKNIESTYYPRRMPEDSRIDPEKSISSQFDRIRVCDPDRFPAFFSLRGYRYKLILEKIDG